MDQKVTSLQEIEARIEAKREALRHSNKPELIGDLGLKQVEKAKTKRNERKVTRNLEESNNGTYHDEPWGKLYPSILEHSTYCALNKRDHTIMNALISHRNGKSGISSPGQKYLLRILNLSSPNRKTPYDVQSVKRAIKSLIEKGLIRRIVKGYHGHCSEYWVAVRGSDIE